MPACKPEAAAFQTVLDAVGASPHSSIMFEDSLKEHKGMPRAALGMRVYRGGGGRGGAARGRGAAGDAESAYEAKIRRIADLKGAAPWLWEKRQAPGYRGTGSSMMNASVVRGARRRRIRARRPKPGGATPSTAASRPRGRPACRRGAATGCSESVDDATLSFLAGGRARLQAHDLLAAELLDRLLLLVERASGAPKTDSAALRTFFCVAWPSSCAMAWRIAARSAVVSGPREPGAMGSANVYRAGGGAFRLGAAALARARRAGLRLVGNADPLALDGVPGRGRAVASRRAVAGLRDGAPRRGEADGRAVVFSGLASPYIVR